MNPKEINYLNERENYSEKRSKSEIKIEETLVNVNEERKQNALEPKNSIVYSEKEIEKGKNFENKKKSELNSEFQELVRNYNLEASKERENQRKIIENQQKESIKNIEFDLPEMENDENLINFMENLNFDKYLKNQEVREALFLLKNKVEKEKENNPEENKQQNYFNEEKEEENEENISQKNEENLNLPHIDPKGSLIGVIHEKGWDGKNYEDPEILKKRVADQILKLNKVTFF